MKLPVSLRGLLLTTALCACVTSLRAQLIELRANLNAAQEIPLSTSPATGTAVMFYDLRSNTFDLIVSIQNMANTAISSHIHEAPVGVAGGFVVNLGGESAYARAGTTVTATFRGLTYTGDRVKLLQGGAYYNIHSQQFTGGEIRGQLIARPKRLVSNMDVAQEQAAFPNVNLSGLNDFGGAVMYYDPVAHRISLRMSLFNFNNTFNNSHVHNGARGVSGGVALNLGNNANAGGYSSANGHISGSFDIPAGNIDPIALLTGQTYLNFHSTTFTGGELRGQLVASDELPGTRFSNLSVRGFVGTGDQVLIQGITVSGPDPIRMLITAKGPWLSNFGVTGVLANPRLALFDRAGRQIAVNDDIGTPAAGSELATLPGVPTNAAESALLVVLPPGNYTAIVSSAGGTGVALLEVADLRTFGESVTASSLVVQAAPAKPAGGLASAAVAALEICAAPLATLTAKR